MATSHWNQTLNTLYMLYRKKKTNPTECVLHCVWHLPHTPSSRHLSNGNGSQPVASRPLGSHVTIQNIQLLPKSLSHNIRHCVSPPRPGSRSHGTLIGNQYGATQPRPKMPFWQNVLSHWTLPQSFTLSRGVRYRVLNLCRRSLLLDSTISTEPVHIPNWEKKEEEKKPLKVYPLTCCIWTSETKITSCVRMCKHQDM